MPLNTSLLLTMIVTGLAGRACCDAHPGIVWTPHVAVPGAPQSRHDPPEPRCTFYRHASSADESQEARSFTFVLKLPARFGPFSCRKGLLDVFSSVCWQQGKVVIKVDDPVWWRGVCDYEFEILDLMLDPSSRDAPSGCLMDALRCIGNGIQPLAGCVCFFLWSCSCRG